MTKPQVAVVVQRYGTEVNGGAELHARWLAEQLLAIAETHVITTCAVDYTTWANYYPSGEETINGVRVFRFPVDKVRDWPKAQKQTGRLLTQDHGIFDELVWIKEQGPFSTALFDFIESSRTRYDAFIFFTYLYATTFFGMQLVPEKAILVPTAHDDAFIKLPVFRSLFHLPRAIVYNTESEKRLVNGLMQNSTVHQAIAGIGINTPSDVSAERFRKKYRIDGQMMLYVGRIDDSKNVPELVRFFALYREQSHREVKLVTIGKAHVNLPHHQDIIHLGFLSEEDKFDGIKAADVVVIPSKYESLSMIALESWLMETPVLVNGECEVLKHQCRRSNAGLYYTSMDEFRIALELLLNSVDTRQQLGRNGQAFVNANYRWPIIVSKYQELLDTVVRGT